MFSGLPEWLMMLSLPWRVFVIGLIPALLTSIGTLPVLLGRRVGERFLDGGLGFSGGVMLVASFTSLLLPAIEIFPMILVISGFVLGALAIYGLDKSIPHLHLVKGYEGPRGFKGMLHRTLLVVLAIIIHNIPEGMSVGVSAIYSVADGLVVALAIGIQDIPEGLAVSLPIYRATKNTGKSLGIGVLSGFSELAAAYIPLGIIALFPGAIDVLLPLFMSFSAGAMIYVVVHELVPEIYSHGHDDIATMGFFTGFIIMLALDTLLG